MPDLLRLASQAKEQPESYKSDILAQQQALYARIELFKMQPNQKDEDLLQLVHFLANMCKIYKDDLKDVPHQIFNLVTEHRNEMDVDLRLELTKNVTYLIYKNFLPPTNDVISQLCCFLSLHDKKLRQCVQQCLLRILPDSQSINTVIILIMSESSSILLKQKLLEVLQELFNTTKLKNQQQYSKISNTFSDLLLQSPDKRIIQTCVNFLLNKDQDDQEDFQKDVLGDDDMVIVKNDQISKLYTKLRSTINAFKLDETKRKKNVFSLQQQIRKLKYSTKRQKRSRYNVLDYLRSPLTFVEKCNAKFFQKSCSFDLRLQLFDLLAQVVDLYQLQTLQLTNIFQKYIKPQQLQIQEIFQFIVKMTNPNQDQSELKSLIKTIFFNFVNASSTDDEMTLGINTIAEMCRRSPNCLLEDKDGQELLNELLSLTSARQVQSAHDLCKKTSSVTQKGVVMAARRLLNFYRKVAPGFLEKRFLDKSSAIEIQSLKDSQKDVFKIKDVNNLKPIERLQNIQIIQEDWVEEEEEYEPEILSKHQKLKIVQMKGKMMRRLMAVRRSGGILEDNELGLISQYLDKNVDINGNSIISENEEEFEEEGFEEFGEDEFDFGEDEEEKELQEEFQKENNNKKDIKIIKKNNYQNYQEEISEKESIQNEEIDPNIPIEQQRCLTQEEIMKLKRFKRDNNEEVDLMRFIRHKKMTAEEKRIHTAESKDREHNHTSNFWNRKDTTRKSRTNKEKLKDKAMAMTIHSDKVRRKAARTRYEKEYVRRQHAYNSKRGIDKKISKV